jgi:hypothetical protein
MSLAARLARLERVASVGHGSMEMHFTAAGVEGRQMANPCSEPSHGPSCAYFMYPMPRRGLLVMTFVGVGLPG